MRWLTLAGVGYLLALISFAAGIYVAHTRSWPFYEIRDVWRFVQGHRDETTSLLQKLTNDMDIRPARALKIYAPTDVDRFDQLDGMAFLDRREENPLLFVSDELPAGYVYITGKFDFLDGMNGTILVSVPDGKLVRSWAVSDGIGKNKHHIGFHMRRDGSIVATASNGPLYHIDRCANEVGVLGGTFHHSIAPIDEHRGWVSGSETEVDAISIVDFDTLTVERTIMLETIHEAADPEIAIFTFRIAGLDSWHLNDVEALPASIAANSPFDAGDLVLSYRHNSLVYVLDPDTLEIKWWTQAFASLQHDPDWQPDGTISLYDNRSHKRGRFLTITSYTPNGVQAPKILLNGERHGFYSDVGGQHTIFDDESILAVSHEQGRVLWVDRDDRVLFEFVNRYSDTEVLLLTNTGFLPADYFDEGTFASCDQS